MSNIDPPKHFRVGITVFPIATSLDFIGPLDVLSTLSKASATRPESLDFSLKCVLLADTLEPVPMSNGMSVVPQMTYENARAEGQEWDVLLIPGGTGARPWYPSNLGTREFLKEVAPRCKYILTGLLEGHRATCNKRAFKSLVIWSSSGVTAGIDMAAAFVRHIVSLHIDDKSKAKEVGDSILGVLEVLEAEQDHDPWSDYYGLV